MGNTAASALLLRLFRYWEKNSDIDKEFSRPITKKMAKEYFATTTYQAKEQLHARLKTAEEIGCIRLTWNKRTSNQILERITLKDPIKLAEFLDQPLASELANTARILLEKQVDTQLDWIIEIQNNLIESWHYGQSQYGLSVDNVDKAINVLNALNAVSQEHHRGRDLRSFSVDYLGNSKTMESIKGIFKTLWQHHHGGDLDAQELYDSLGLVKFAQPILLQAQCTIVLDNARIDCCNVKPYIGLAPQSINDIEFTTPPNYVLTIENLASFNRYCAEIVDGGLILYSNGFPSPDFGDLIRLLHTNLAANVPFYHWGDVDLGGLRIFSHIQNFLFSGKNTRTLLPHLMSQQLVATNGQTQTQLSRSQFDAVLTRCPQLHEIVGAIFSHKNAMVLEQESLSPVSPV